MRDLNGCFAIEIRIVGQHAAEHGDIGRGVGALEDKIGFDLDLLVGEFLFRQFAREPALFGTDEGELRRARRRKLRGLFVILGRLIG